MYSTVKNPRWAVEDKSSIDCDVVFDNDRDFPVPFTAAQNDPENHGREIFKKCMDGDFGPIADFVPVVVYERQSDEEPMPQSTVIGAQTL